MKTYSLVAAAALLGVNRTTLAGWLTKGCPAETRADRSRGVEWELSIPAIFEWRTAYVVREAVATYQGTAENHVTKEEADRRRAVAMAIVAEVEADTMLKAAVSRHDAEECMAEFCQALKGGLGNAAHKVSGRAALMTDPHEILEVCHHEFNRSFVNVKAELDRLWNDRTEAPPNEDSDDDT